MIGYYLALVTMPIWAAGVAYGVARAMSWIVERFSR